MTFREPDPSTPTAGWLALAMELCDAADDVSLRHFRRDLQIDTKPDRSYVTQADRAIEKQVRERIAHDYPDHGLVGEEYGEQAGASTVRWYVDPIDGTHNYMRGIPIFATLLALEEDGEIRLGLMSAPALHTRWFAWRGGGAWAIELPSRGMSGFGDARQLHVSKIATLSDSQLLFSSFTGGEAITSAPGLTGTLSAAWRTRGLGDFWGYALVAEGSAEAMVEEGMHSWDLAPALVIVEEAGGRLTDLDGNRTIHGQGALASNGLLHSLLLDSLHEPG